MPRLRHLSLAVGLAACGVGDSLLPADFAACPADEPAPEPPAGLTYYRDVKPILDARCAGCHVDGGIAPMALTDYEAAMRYQDLIYAEVEAERMPPWQPNDCCADYRWTRSLSPDERATVLAWIEQGFPAGDPADEPPPLPTDRQELPRVDLTLRLPEPYTPVPRIGVDDVRCFLIDWPIDEQVYVTGFEFRPGNRKLVHHVAAMIGEADDVDDLRARDAADDGPGFDCTGFGLDFRPTGSLGGWTPGDLALPLPGGLGRKVPAGSVVLLQIHYDTGSGRGESDQSEIDLMIAQEVEREAEASAVGNPLWLVEDAMYIEAHDPDAMFWFEYDPTHLNGGDGFLIWGVNIHMHELGSRASLAIHRGDGSWDCLLDIPDWDFHWLSDYWLAEPVAIYPGDRLYVECHFDNTTGNQKIVNGQQQEPRDLWWGTDLEMCGGILFTSDLEPEAR